MRRLGIYGIPLLCIAILIGAIVWLHHDRQPPPAGDKPEALVLLCNPLLEPPMQAIIEGFQRRFGLPVEARYLPPGQLLNELTDVDGSGDVFVPVDPAIMQRAVRLGLVGNEQPLLLLRPVIQVARGNPLDIQSVADLGREGVRLALGDAQDTVIGRVARELLHAQGIDAGRLEAQVTVASVDLNQLGRAISLRHADAAITWAPLARRHPLTESIALPYALAPPLPVAASIATGSSDPDGARTFVRFLHGQAARDNFNRHHFEVHTAD